MVKKRFGWLGLLILLPLCLSAGGDISARAAKLHRQAIVVDTHIDTPQRLLDEEFDLAARDLKGHIDIPRMKEGGLDAGFMSIYVDMRRQQGLEATRRALQLIDTVYQQAARHPDQIGRAHV